MDSSSSGEETYVDAISTNQKADKLPLVRTTKYEAEKRSSSQNIVDAEKLITGEVKFVKEKEREVKLVKEKEGEIDKSSNLHINNTSCLDTGTNSLLLNEDGIKSSNHGQLTVHENPGERSLSLGTAQGQTQAFKTEDVNTYFILEKQTEHNEVLQPETPTLKLETGDVYEFAQIVPESLNTKPTLSAKSSDADEFYEFAQPILESNIESVSSASGVKKDSVYYSMSDVITPTFTMETPSTNQNIELEIESVYEEYLPDSNPGVRITDPDQFEHNLTVSATDEKVVHVYKPNTADSQPLTLNSDLSKSLELLAFELDDTVQVDSDPSTEDNEPTIEFGASGVYEAIKDVDIHILPDINENKEMPALIDPIREIMKRGSGVMGGGVFESKLGTDVQSLVRKHGRKGRGNLYKDKS